MIQLLEQTMQLGMVQLILVQIILIFIYFHIVIDIFVFSLLLNNL